jgi:methyl-accepting chemotaxis protein
MASLNPLSSAHPLAKRIFMLFQVCAMPIAPFAAYLLGLVLELKGDEVMRSLVWLLPVTIAIYGNLYPYLLIRYLLSRATRSLPGETPSARLIRLFKTPWRIATIGMTGSYGFGACFFSGMVCLWFDKDLVHGLMGTGIGLVIGLLLSIPVFILVERWMMPLVIEEQERQPELRIIGSDFSWVRQSWFLPYTFIVCVLSLVLMGGTAVGVQTATVQRLMAQQMLDANQPRAAEIVQNLTHSLLAELSVPVAALLVILLSLSTISAWMMARRLEQGSLAVLRAIEGISVGRVQPSRWASTDELGDLAFGLNAIVAQLGAIPRSLQSLALQLMHAGETLRQANEAQRQALSGQAASLQETHVTAQRIKETSDLTAQRAAAVLDVVTHAQELGHAGTLAIEQTMAGFASIRNSVHAIRDRMERLQASAQQIGDITQAVEDLADQSNMLALNAAIESVRSGENGKGFGVVAREIRLLADQSIRATGRIRGILDEVGRAIEDAVSMTDAGAAQAEGGLSMVKTSGESLRQLSQMVNESSAAVRQIASAVNQQNSGFAQIFTAIAELSHGMEQAMDRLESTHEAAKTLQHISDQVNQVARQYHST